MTPELMRSDDSDDSSELPQRFGPCEQQTITQSV